MGSTRCITTPADRIFATNVLLARRARGLSAARLTAGLYEMGYVEFSDMAVHKIEHGERRVSLGEALAICSVLDVSLETMTKGPLMVAFS